MTKYFEGEHLDEIRLARDNNMVELVYKRPGSNTDIVRFHLSLLFPFIKEQLKITFKLDKRVGVITD
jgi:hypothetical protein